MRRIPTLDGWRGIAILLVIVAHVQAGLLGHVWRYAWMDLGQHGVGIFFVLSGYLITSRLLCDERGLGSFYIRRFFRLMPCVCLYLAVLPLVGLLLHTRLLGHEVWACLFFYRNYFPQAENAHNAFTSHFWSLSMEEQFYLFWPFILTFAGKRRSFAIAVVGACTCAAVRFAMWDQASRHKLATEVRIDALLIGCTLAFLLEWEAVRSFISRHSALLFYGSLPVFFWCVYRFQAIPPFKESIAIATMIAVTSLTPSSWVGRVLENRHLKFLGIISYSVYVWQELFLLPHWGFIGLALLVPVSIGSYMFIERPGVKLGRKVQGWFERRERAAPEMAVGPVRDGFVQS